ncbi:type I-D CRISPR-associated protein Cas5/Csc1 [Chloroflexi bacterium TSY]|nr:type I-D CRISPR-associated protein Cas5/Csc1 [Chloroflexi bacterium TSY]
MFVTICDLTLHENLFYATREIGRLYETGRYLHNYGLSYALGFAVAPYFNNRAMPRYSEDLSVLNESQIYVTPAKPKNVTFELNTFKYADNRYRVKMELGQRNTPSFGRAKEIAVGSTFEFAVLSPQPMMTKRWIRLGKWMSKSWVDVRAEVEVEQPRESEAVAHFPINPLDISNEIKLQTYDLISMPPVSLLDNVHFVGPHYRLEYEKRHYVIPTNLAYRFSE